MKRLYQILLIFGILGGLMSPIMAKASSIDDVANLLQPAPWETVDNGIPLVQPVVNKTVYYAIASPYNSWYSRVWRKAVTQWANLNVLKFKQVAITSNRPHITLTGTYNKAKATSEFNHLHQKDVIDGNTYNLNQYQIVNGHAILQNTICSLLPAGGYYASTKDVMAVAEHEFGHALGFAHDNQLVNGHGLIMSAVSNNQPNPLGKHEWEALYQHYGYTLY